MTSQSISDKDLYTFSIYNDPLDLCFCIHLLHPFFMFLRTRDCDFYVLKFIISKYHNIDKKGIKKKVKEFHYF